MNYLLPSSLGFDLNPKYEFPPHLERVQEFILNAVFTDNGRAVVSLPVRTGKSYFCSYVLPCWLLLTRPETRILLVSHSGRFSELFGNMVKQVVDKFGMGGSALDSGYKSRADFRTVAGGGLVSRGWIGSVAGRGFDLIICDDMVKDALQVMSPTNREKMSTWLRTDLLTRCEPRASVVSVLSRRHPEDPAGLFLGMGWPELKIPALNDNDESIWETRFSSEDLKRKRQELEDSGQGWVWSCLYQCEPIDPSSVSFPRHWIEDIYTDTEPKGGINILSIDPSKARKAEQKNNDPCGMVVVNINKNNDMTVIDGFSKKIPATDIVEEAVQLIKKYRPKIVSCETIDLQHLILVSLEQRLAEEKLLYSTNLKSYEPKTDKTCRIELTLSPLLSQGKIKVMKKPCLKPLITELEQFPHSLHDDFVDSLCQSVWCAINLRR